MTRQKNFFCGTQWYGDPESGTQVRIFDRCYTRVTQAKSSERQRRAQNEILRSTSILPQLPNSPTTLPPGMEPQSTSWDLIALAGSGDADAKDLFANTYEPIVRKYLAMRLRLPIDHYQVLDNTQEVLLQCFKSNGVLDNALTRCRGNFRPYLQGIATRVAANAIRRRVSRPERTNQSASHRDIEQQVEPRQSTVFDNIWVDMVLQEATVILKQQFRSKPSRLQGLKALRLRYQRRLGCPEIAQRLGISNEQVYETLRVAKKDFRLALMAAMSNHYPNMTESELKSECSSLAATL